MHSKLTKNRTQSYPTQHPTNTSTLLTDDSSVSILDLNSSNAQSEPIDQPKYKTHLHKTLVKGLQRASTSRENSTHSSRSKSAQDHSIFRSSTNRSHPENNAKTLPHSDSYLEANIFNKFQSAKLSSAQERYYRETFALYSISGSSKKSGNGEDYLTMRGLDQFLKHIGDRSSRAEDVMRNYDGSRDGKLTYKEVYRYFAERNAGALTTNDMEAVFDAVDKDADGMISLDEFRKILCCTTDNSDEGFPEFTEDEVLLVFRNIDRDGKGTISRNELCAFLTQELVRN